MTRPLFYFCSQLIRNLSDEEQAVLAKQRTFKRLGYKIKRALSSAKESEQKKIATMADIENKVANYQPTQGRASFTGPRVMEKDTTE